MGDPGTVLALAHASGPLTLGGFARLAARGERREFRRGAEVVRQGERADTMFVILAGRVSVAREHPQLSVPVVLAELGPGDVVGEMGLLDGEPRSATVTAIEDTVTVQIPGHEVAACIAEDPGLYASLVKALSKRLRSTNDLAAEMASGAGADPPPEREP